MNRRYVRLCVCLALMSCFLLFALSQSASASLDIEELLYPSPWGQLSIEYVQWQNADNNRLNVRFKVINWSSIKTVKAFEIYVYAEDVWGEAIYGNTVYYATTKKKVPPGEAVYSDYITLPQRRSIGIIYGGLHRVLYDDGTVDEFEGSSLDYQRFEYDP